MTNKLEELTDRELQERLLINVRLIKKNVKTITTWVIVFGVIMIVSIIIAVISSGALD